MDSANYTAPQTFNWTQGTSHTLNVTSPQSGASGTRYVFSSWSDGGAQSHTYVAPASAETVTANFTTQYQLATAVNPAGAGTINQTNGSWHNSGAVLSVQATANSGYAFSNWSGALSGSVNPQNLVMSEPRSVTANFTTPPDETPPSVTVATCTLAGTVSDDKTCPADVIVDGVSRPVTSTGPLTGAWTSQDVDVSSGNKTIALSTTDSSNTRQVNVVVTH